MRHGGLKGWGQSCRSQYNQSCRERQALGSGMVLLILDVVYTLGAGQFGRA